MFMGTGATRFTRISLSLLATVAVTAAGVLAPGLARAADAYPSQPIRFVVPYPPGGNSDNLARILADRLRAKLDTPIIVENKPGGTTSLGTDIVARSAPDGYTMLLLTSTAFTVLPHLRKLPYDPDTSFEFIGSVAGYLPIVTVRNGLGVSDMKSLIELARKQPGKLTWGSSGVASGGHLAGEIIKSEAGVDMLHVPFKGSADAVAALMGDQVDFIIDGVGLELVKSGRAKGLATFSSQRHPELPDVPAIGETGFRFRLPFEGFWGLAMPKGTPQAIVDKVAQATSEALAEPDLQQRFVKVSVTADWKPGKEYGQALANDREYYGKLIKQIGLDVAH